MKPFACDHCGSLIFFENIQCLACQHALGFLPDLLELSALELNEAKAWRPLAEAANGRSYRSCDNGVRYQVCNWLVPSEDPNPLCQACRLNQTIPDLSLPENRARWQKIETAKRRLVYTLIYLGLSTEGNPKEKRPPLHFSFLADPPNGARVLTGHKDGVITLNISEADDVKREQRRINFREPYRTLLGHFRHEIAHYFWDQLIANTPRLEGFRRVFGDERQDYQAALNAYYKNGAPSDWSQSYVSLYASAHPWEDWAETWAHYLHIQDTVETAAGFGMMLKPKHPEAKTMEADLKQLDGRERSFDHILNQWFPLTYAANELNRGMGLPDVYPFVLPTPAINKLRYIHDVVLDASIRHC